jgi:hypothetical protein
MKRLALVVAVTVSAFSVGKAQAGPLAAFERWWGIHCGPGIHAYNGCGPKGYVGYGAEYPEEVAPGISEMDELKSSRRPQPRTSRTQPQSGAPRGMTR